MTPEDKTLIILLGTDQQKLALLQTLESPLDLENFFNQVILPQLRPLSLKVLMQLEREQKEPNLVTYLTTLFEGRKNVPLFVLHTLLVCFKLPLYGPDLRAQTCVRENVFLNNLIKQNELKRLEQIETDNAEYVASLMQIYRRTKER